MPILFLGDIHLVVFDGFTSSSTVHMSHKDVAVKDQMKKI